jgi:hypothetical protein
MMARKPPPLHLNWPWIIVLSASVAAWLEGCRFVASALQ